MKFNFSDAYTWDPAEYAAEHNAELAVAHAAIQWYEHLRRIKALRDAREEIEESETLSEYAADAAAYGLDGLIDTEKERADNAHEVFAQAIKLNHGLSRRKSGVFCIFGFSEETDKSLSQIPLWEDCKKWLESGYDIEPFLYG